MFNIELDYEFILGIIKNYIEQTLYIYWLIRLSLGITNYIFKSATNFFLILWLVAYLNNIYVILKPSGIDVLIFLI